MVDESGTTALCQQSADRLDVSGAGIMLVTGKKNRGVLCASNATSGAVEELQFTLGEGPCVDACETGLPIFAPDLGAPDFSRWPAFAPPAIMAGVRAIFGFPLQVGPIRLGALDVYNDQPGDLQPEQIEEAVNLAGVVTRRVLELQARADPGALPSELDTSGTLRSSVHQASGMLSARYEISVEEALLRLRAYAFTAERPINDVARDVVARRLNIE